MSYNEKLNQTQANIDAAYKEAQERLSAYRLQATLYDTAQAIIDRDRPGKTVVEILINTDTATPVKELLEKADAVVENAKKQPPKKVVYSIQFAAKKYGTDEYRTWPTHELPPEVNQFTALVDAVKEAKKLLLPGLGAAGERENLFYFILEREVEA